MISPRSHGLEIRKGGFIKNVVVEQLLTDPEVIVPGRIWYNSTEHLYKGSFRDPITQNLVIKAFVTEDDLRSSFINLTDTPDDYGTQGQVLSSTGNGLNWQTLPSTKDKLIELTDAPNNYGTQGQVLKSTGTSIIWGNDESADWPHMFHGEMEPSITIGVLGDYYLQQSNNYFYYKQMCGSSSTYQCDIISVDDIKAQYDQTVELLLISDWDRTNFGTGTYNEWLNAHWRNPMDLSKNHFIVRPYDTFDVVYDDVNIKLFPTSKSSFYMNDTNDMYGFIYVQTKLGGYNEVPNTFVKQPPWFPGTNPFTYEFAADFSNIQPKIVTLDILWEDGFNLYVGDNNGMGCLNVVNMDGIPYLLKDIEFNENGIFVSRITDFYNARHESEYIQNIGYYSNGGGILNLAIETPLYDISSLPIQIRLTYYGARTLSIELLDEGSDLGYGIYSLVASSEQSITLSKPNIILSGSFQDDELNNSSWVFYYNQNSGQLHFDYTVDGVGVINHLIDCPLMESRWYRFAITGADNYLYFFIDGYLYSSIEYSGIHRLSTLNSNQYDSEYFGMLQIGDYWRLDISSSETKTKFHGHMDQIRWSNICKYTENYTIDQTSFQIPGQLPVNPTTSVNNIVKLCSDQTNPHIVTDQIGKSFTYFIGNCQNSSDKFLVGNSSFKFSKTIDLNHTSFLIHSESPSFDDMGGSLGSPTVIGNIQWDNVNKVFTKSLRFDGSSYLSYNGLITLVGGSTYKTTFETRIMFTQNQVGRVCILSGVSGEDKWTIGYNWTTNKFFVEGIDLLPTQVTYLSEFNFTPILNQWYHIAFCQGIYDGDTTSSSYLFVNGIRIAKNTTITARMSYVDPRNIFLGGSPTETCFIGNIENTFIMDKAIYTNEFTVSNNDIVPWQPCIYATYNYDMNIYLDSEMTIQFWINFNYDLSEINDNYPINLLSVSDNHGGFSVKHDSWQIIMEGDNDWFCSSIDVSTWKKNEWHHIAIVYKNGNLKLYADGVSSSDIYTPTCEMRPFDGYNLVSKDLFIGYPPYRVTKYTGDNPFDGYINGFDWIKEALYTENFNPWEDDRTGIIVDSGEEVECWDHIATLKGSDAQQISSILDLSDTPTTYGSVDQFLAMDSSGTRLVWKTPTTPAVRFIDLTDTPSTLGFPNQLLGMNDSGTFIEWKNPPAIKNNIIELNDTPNTYGIDNQILAMDTLTQKLIWKDLYKLTDNQVPLITDSTSAENSDIILANRLKQLEEMIGNISSGSSLVYFVYTSPEPLFIHNITHNLNSENLAITVWVNTDGIWERDVTYNKIVDNNNIIVELQESQNIKVIVQAIQSNAIGIDSFIYESTIPIQNHTIVHNLNNTNILISVWSVNNDSSYTLDIMEVRILDNNTISVLLTDNENIKVIIQAVGE